MNRVVVKSRVGGDGILHLMVTLGAAEAGREVKVTVEPVGGVMSQEEWRERVLALAGQWQGDWERPEQGEYEERARLS
jgi:hypothetical protein